MLTYKQILENRIRVIDLSIQFNILKLTELLMPEHKINLNIENSESEILNKFKEFLEISGIDYDKLRSMNRNDNLQNCRKIIIMELHYLGYNQKEIADLLRKDRTSIIYHIKKFEPKYNLNLKKSLEKFIKLYPSSKLAKLYKGI